jgi:hypothetical protein
MFYLSAILDIRRSTSRRQVGFGLYGLAFIIGPLRSRKARMLSGSGLDTIVSMTTLLAAAKWQNNGASVRRDEQSILFRSVA